MSKNDFETNAFRRWWNNHSDEQQKKLLIAGIVVIFLFPPLLFPIVIGVIIYMVKHGEEWKAEDATDDDAELKAALEDDELYDPEKYESVNFAASLDSEPSTIIVNGKATKVRNKNNPFEM